MLLMAGIEPHLQTVLFTVLSLELALLAARFARREGRADHLRLLALVGALALDELAPPGLLSWLGVYLVVVAAGVALAPRHRAVRALAVAGGVSAAVTSGAWLVGCRAGICPVILGCVLSLGLGCVPATLLFLERPWMGARVFAAVLAGGLLWFAGRLAGFVLPGVPTPGLPFAAVIGVSIVTWWFTPDGPVSGRWYAHVARLEGRLQSTEGQLLRQDRLSAVGFLAAGAAHEFRNALAAIGALVQWGRRGVTADAKDAALEGIGARVSEASRNVASVLEGISRDGRETERRVNLRTDLDRMMGFVRATCRRDGIAVSYEVSGEPVILARPSEVEHILLSFLHNSARALGSSGRGDKRVTVRSAVRDGVVVVEVEDTGGGVPESIVPRLFAPLSSGAAGAGVGLYLSRSLAERNGATVAYQPVPGGSLFRVVFPAASGDVRGEPA